ncbi:chitobiase-like [Mytilus californianus]|uniref:chitobiase-like n=1 Tax=Mytilus californianus TaxID=6549 RepID=UPI0022459B42|nr:chitobiase-like [Mytilus californianus]XP_052085035.1 chitobiase-like [Mytilus californianus]XP_052085036.1 chitobiase-like [Mytilus californianus]XP_052085037.1 chitobiase-like [Mytilus californianus]
MDLKLRQFRNLVIAVFIIAMCIHFISISDVFHYHWSTHQNLAKTSQIPQKEDVTKRDIKQEPRVEQQNVNVSTDQELINYLAKYLDVIWTVKDDAQYNTEHILFLKNIGLKRISQTDWKIYFSQMSILNPNLKNINDSYPKNVVVGEDKTFILTHVSGSLYCIYPRKEVFIFFEPGSKIKIPLTATKFQRSRTDSLPNWYVVGSKSKPKIIESTKGENLNFVKSFGSQLTSKERYKINNNHTDLKRTQKYVVPSPEEIAVMSNDTIMLKLEEWVIQKSDEFPDEVKYLADALKVKVATNASPDKVIKMVKGKPIFKNTQLGESDEAYELKIDGKSTDIQITATTGHGIFNGVQTLLSLADKTVESGPIVFNSVTIKDRPRFKYRGIMLDVSRNFHSKETVFKLLDLMAMYKLNKFHLHLSDDEGWRLEIPDIPELTQLGSKRCHDESETLCLMPSLGSGPYIQDQGPEFYNIIDYKEILKYANERHIQVIPEIDMPSHMRAALKSISLRASRKGTIRDQYKMTDKADSKNYRSLQGYNDNIANPCRDGLYDFVDKVIDTVVEAHKDIQPLTLFHFGGDKVPKPALQGMKCKENKIDLMHNFIQRLFQKKQFTNVSFGAWDDSFLKPDKTPYTVESLHNITKENRSVYAFVYQEENKAVFKLANSGYKVINSPASLHHFDHPYEKDTEERGSKWATEFINTKMVFAFNPLKGEDDYGELKKPENIVGIQAHVWTELVQTTDQLEYMMFPRLIAFAERAWHHASWHETNNVKEMERDWIEFLNYLVYKELPKLDKLNVHYRIPPPGAIIEDGKLHVNTYYPGLTVEYSVDSPGNEKQWYKVTGDETLSEQIILRTLSADGKRHSREIKLDRSIW